MGQFAGVCCMREHCCVGHRFKALVLVAAMQHVSMSTQREDSPWFPAWQTLLATSHSLPTTPLHCRSTSSKPVRLTLALALVCQLDSLCPLETQRQLTTALACQ